MSAPKVKRCTRRWMVQSSSGGTCWKWCERTATATVNGRAFCKQHARLYKSFNAQIRTALRATESEDPRG